MLRTDTTVHKHTHMYFLLFLILYTGGDSTADTTGLGREGNLFPFPFSSFFLFLFPLIFLLFPHGSGISSPNPFDPAFTYCIRRLFNGRFTLRNIMKQIGTVFLSFICVKYCHRDGKITLIMK